MNKRSGGIATAIRILTGLFFLAFFVVSLYYLNKLLVVKSPHGINQARAMYAQPENSIDVVFLGSSHIHYDVNTAYLWKEHGIASYDYSSAEQPLWMTYHYIREFLKTQRPQLIVIDLFAPAYQKDDFQYDFLAENTYGLKFSRNKYEAEADMMEAERWADFFPAFFAMHSRYGELKEEDWIAVTDPGRLKNFKGFTPYVEYGHWDLNEPSQDRAEGYTPKQSKFLEKIYELSLEEEIPLFFIVTPYAAVSPEEEMFYNRSQQICADVEIPCINYNHWYESIGLDPDYDLYDDSHLSYTGSIKFTEFLYRDLAAYTELIDRRGQEGYESWDANAEIIDRYVAGETKILY